MTGPDAAALYAAHAPRIRAYLAARTQDAALAEDLTQDVFVRAWRSSAPVRSPLALLYAIARHVHASHVRDQGRGRRLALGRAVPLEAVEAPSVPPVVEDDLSTAATWARVTKALAPDDLALARDILEGTTLREAHAAHGQGRSYQSLYRRWVEIRATLRTALDATGSP